MKTKILYSENFQLFLILLFIISFGSCQVLRPSYVKEPKPDWVSSRPQNNMYYLGISSSPKKGYLPSDYVANAQQNALSDLAGGISVNIESTSVLSVMENTFEFNENFTSEITATTNEQLEGYELVDTWEDNDYYWVYYRLLKTKYQQIKLQKKEQSILDAKSKYYQAKELLDRDLHYNAFRFYVESLTALKTYLGDCTTTDIYGETKDIGNEVFTEMSQFVNNLNINFKSSTITVKKGVEVDDEDFAFTITDQNGKPVSSIPVKVSFTGTGLIRSSEVSGNDGKVYCAINKVTSSAGNESLTVSVDMTKFARAANDHMIRSLIRNIPSSEKLIRVIVERPVLQIKSEEKAFDEILTDNKLKNTFQTNLSSDFYINDKDTPDFVLSIASNTFKNGKFGNEYIVVIDYSVDLRDSRGNIIYRKTKSGEYSGLSLDAAVNEAYLETQKSIERIIAREVTSAVNK